MKRAKAAGKMKRMRPAFRWAIVTGDGKMLSVAYPARWVCKMSCRPLEPGERYVKVLCTEPRAVARARGGRG